MTPITAVVLEKSQPERDDIRFRLSSCGILPICFKDEWVCLENIHCIKPSFAVLRSDSAGSTATFVNAATAIQNRLPIIVLSSDDNTEALIRKNWQANLSFLRYPADNQDYQLAIDHLFQERSFPAAPILIGGSAERNKLIQELPLISALRDPVLIQGEAGVGKKLIARTIHRLSMNSGSPFTLVDAAEITGGWIQESKIHIDTFGSNQVPWYVIDNIEKLPLDSQAQLLLLVEHTDSRGITPNRAGIRFISLTTQDMARWVKQGDFRKDLYHRLGVLKLNVPALRCHARDIAAMTEYFAMQYSIRQRGVICRLTEPVMKSFLDYHWPGNVAELKRIVKQLVVTDESCWKDILPEPDKREKNEREKKASVCGIDTDEIRQYLKLNAKVTLKQARSYYTGRVEKKILKVALAQTNGNCKQAAGLLNISYKSMLNKVKLYQLV